MRPSCTSPPTSAKMRASRASLSCIHAVQVWMTAHGRPADSSSASHSCAVFSRNLASKSSATRHEEGQLNPMGSAWLGLGLESNPNPNPNPNPNQLKAMGSARLRSSKGALAGSYGSCRVRARVRVRIRVRVRV